MIRLAAAPAPRRFSPLGEWAALSSDGRLVLAIALIVLLDPYLPQFGPLAGRVRADSFLLPLVALWMLVRDAMSGRLTLIRPLALYVAFIAWLLAVTVATLGYPPKGFSPAPLVAIVAGTENYLRPLFLLLIATKSRTTREDLVVLTRVMVVLAIPLCAIAFLQLYPPTASQTNDIIYRLFSNERQGERTAQLFANVIGGGRVQSIFGQPGTFGQFCIFIVGLHLAQWLGRLRLISRELYLTSFALALLGGVFSGSKVFFGGIIMLGVFLPLMTPLVRRVATPKSVLLLLLFVLGLGVVGKLMLEDHAIRRVTSSFSVAKAWETYSAGRFNTIEPGGRFKRLDPKVIRSGALDVIRAYPATGLGLKVVNRTVDSFWIGLLAMTGVVGTILYGVFLLAVLARLYVRSGRGGDPVAAPLARQLIFLTLIFAAAALGFHTFIQDRAGDIYWIFVGVLCAPVGRAARVRLRARRVPDLAGAV
ncbi:MAG: hypothetical protein ABR559_03310 [Gemmatimonadota bacterium]